MIDLGKESHERLRRVRTKRCDPVIERPIEEGAALAWAEASEERGDGIADGVGVEERVPQDSEAGVVLAKARAERLEEQIRDRQEPPAARRVPPRLHQRLSFAPEK